MKTISVIISMFFLSFLLSAQEGIYKFKMPDIHGDTHSLSEYRGKVLLIVNVASKCGYTPQYEALQKLYEKYREQGLVVLAFPANDFLKQEPGSDAEILEFCRRNYGVTFPVFSKIHVKGKKIHPLYRYLREESGRDVKWNFQKYLIDRNGKIIRVFAPKVKPDSEEMIQAIESVLS